MTDANPVNQQFAPFNTQGELFNSNTVAARPTRFITPLPTTTLPGMPSRPTRPRVLTQLEGEAKQVVTDTPAIPTRLMSGSFSGVRAARMAHMHEQAIFDVIRVYLTQTTKSDPTDAQIDEQYADLQTFSYLPAQLMPTREEFGQMSRPSQVAGYIGSVMDKISGASRPTVRNPPREDGTATLPLLPARTPYSQALNAFCAERFFTGTINVEV